MLNVCLVLSAYESYENKIIILLYMSVCSFLLERGIRGLLVDGKYR
jgi:hypothetical protein